MEIPFKSLITIQPTHPLPIYVQITNAFIQQIQQGILKKGTPLLGSRSMAKLLEVNRQTVVAAYQELQSQGWIESLPRKGCFVAQHLPTFKPKPLPTEIVAAAALRPADALPNFPIHLPVFISQQWAFNDGLPDVRLAPREELARLYAHYIRYGEPALLQYVPVLGNNRFRENLAQHLNQTRGLSVSAAQIISTRGSQMGIYLVAAALIQAQDTVVVGQWSYTASTLTFQHFGATIETIPVDDEGLQVEELAVICSKKRIKAVYVTSHHYHPTTVTLKPERRIRLLQLAELYGFFIIEDDYDYDFHYANRPVLPLASADAAGWVIYVGSFTKKIAPTFRVGYVVATEKLITELGKIRRIIDRQGDTLLENCLADMLLDGTLKRYTHKALKAYQARRDFTSAVLHQEASRWVQHQTPDGGMAIWARFDPDISLKNLATKVAQRGLYLSDGQAYQPLNACRMGFASMNLPELETALHILIDTLKKF